MARKIFPREKRLIMIIKKNSLKNLPHKQFWILVIFSEVEEVEIRFYLEKISSLKIVELPEIHEFVCLFFLCFCFLEKWTSVEK